MTGATLKKYIFDHFCDSLEPKDMSITYEGTKISNSTKLSDIQIVVGTSLTIQQNKISVSEISNIIADVHGIDLISDEQGVAKMPCGHHIGRDTMTTMVRSLIDCNKYEIRCPYPDEN